MTVNICMFCIILQIYFGQQYLYIDFIFCPLLKIHPADNRRQIPPAIQSLSEKRESEASGTSDQSSPEDVSLSMKLFYVLFRMC